MHINQTTLAKEVIRVKILYIWHFLIINIQWMLDTVTKLTLFPVSIANIWATFQNKNIKIIGKAFDKCTSMAPISSKLKIIKLFTKLK